MIQSGKITHSAPVGIPPGTIVAIENLFGTVPARKKFLKSQQTEFRHILDIVNQFALLYPHIHFSLTHNKKTIMDMAQKHDIEERIAPLLGQTIYENLVPIQFMESYFSIKDLLANRKLHLEEDNGNLFLLIIGLFRINLFHLLSKKHLEHYSR